MIEKIFTIENISPVDFLGVENRNANELAQVFPKLKIISRGNELFIQGEAPEVMRIMDILESLTNHYHQFGRLTESDVQNYALEENPDLLKPRKPEDSGLILYGAKGNPIKAKTVNQIKLVQAVLQHDLVFALGPAGTGKTFISVALAVRALKEKRVKRIIITRPAVEAGENLGFLPGDLKEKLDPYLRPIYDALHDLIPFEKLSYYMEREIIEIAPLAYMRGRTLQDAFILLDESQNTTPNQMEMFLTRMGPNSKMIVTGDTSQVDLPQRQLSGLNEAIRLLHNVSGIAFVRLGERDVMRHKLVRKIIEAYATIKNAHLKDT